MYFIFYFFNLPYREGTVQFGWCSEQTEPQQHFTVQIEPYCFLVNYLGPGPIATLQLDRTKLVYSRTKHSGGGKKKKFVWSRTNRTTTLQHLLLSTLQSSYVNVG